MTSTPTRRTKAEIDATVRKLEAEAAKAEAEAQVKLLEAEAGQLEIEAAHELRILGRQNFAELQAADSQHHVYRFSSQVTSSSVKECMSVLQKWARLEPGSDMEIVFTSPGGEIISGMALFDFIQMLRHAGHHVTTGCIGMAASMAGILLQAGDHRWVGEQGWIMIHRAAFGAAGKTFEVEDEVEFVKRIEKRILAIFTKRSTLTAKKIQSNWDRKDWWIEAEEAFELGLVDEVRGALV